MKLTRFLSLLLVGGLLLTGCAAQSAPEMATPETATPETATPETATPATATPESAEPDPLQAVLATCADNLLNAGVTRPLFCSSLRPPIPVMCSTTSSGYSSLTVSLINLRHSRLLYSVPQSISQ